jgi:hypothetical protein
MHEPQEIPDTREHRDMEFQDAHFHDDEDDVPADDIRNERTHHAATRRPIPKSPQRRYEFDE